MLIKITNPGNEPAVGTSVAGLEMLGTNAVTITIDSIPVIFVGGEAYVDDTATTWNSNLTLAQLTYIINEILKLPEVTLVPQESVVSVQVAVNTASPTTVPGESTAANITNVRGSGIFKVAIKGLDSQASVVYTREMVVRTVPEAPISFKCSGATSSSLTFKWVRPLVRMPLTTGAKLRLTPVGGGDTILVTKTKAELANTNVITATGLPSGTSFSCYLVHYNASGESLPSATAIATTL